MTTITLPSIKVKENLTAKEVSEFQKLARDYIKIKFAEYQAKKAHYYSDEEIVAMIKETRAEPGYMEEFYELQKKGSILPSSYHKQKERDQYTKEDAKMISELRKTPGWGEAIKADMKKNKEFFASFARVIAS